MQTFAKTPRQETSKERGGSAQQSQSAESSSLRGLMALQRTAGNAAVGQLLRGAIAKAKAEQEAPETQAESDRESERAPIPRGERDRQRERKENPSGTENGIEQGVLQSEQASPPAEVSGSLPASEGPIATDRATVGGSDNQFVSLTQAPASDIVQRIHGGFANDLKDEFASVRLASAERAPVLRVSLPGDELAPAKPKAPAPSKLPSADRIAVPEGNAEDNLAAEETAVPLQPGGDAVQTSAGFAPRIRLDGAAAPGHANAAVTQAGSLGHEIQSQVGAEISEAATAAKIRRVGVEREETLEFADSSQSPATQASTEMLEYLATDVPPNVRQMADDDFGPVLEQVLSPARQKVEQATTDRDTQRDQAFAEVVEQTEAASKKANEQQQQAVSDGYDQISAEKQKGLEEGQQTLDTFDAEVKNRHTAHQDEINTKVQTEQEKADDAIRKGEEDARKEEEKAREEERITREEAERDRPEKPKKKWYQKVGDWFKNAIKSWNDKLVGAVKAVFNKAKELVSKVLTFAKNVAVGIIRSLKKFVVAAIKTLATGLKILVNGLLIAFPKLRARVNAAIDGVVEATVSAVETIAQNLEQTVTAAIDRVESTVNRVLDFCEMVIVTQIEIVSAILSGEFLNAAKYLFLAACKAVGIPGEEFLDILADARDGLMDIIKRPAKFLGYMIKSVGQGMKNFFSHFPQRMVAGLTGWLFGQVAQGGITMAKSFDLKSIFVLLIQVMGFTYDYIRAKVISLVGEKAVSVIEQVMTPIRILFTEGPGALWKWLADKAQDAKDAIVEAASQWLITKIIQQAAIKLATMFTPVGAFVQAVLMMYNTIMFFVEKIKEIFAWVKSITSSIKTIATGAISAAANYIDQAMSKSIPLIITFLAKLMGIDGISEKIRQVVTKLRAPVDKAISFVVENLIKLAKAAWGGIKKGATAVKDAVVGWWEAATNFVTPDGGQHRLFYEGDGEAAVLMLASEKEPADEKLKRLEQSNPENQQIRTAADLVKKNEELRNRRASTPDQEQQKKDTIQQNLDAIANQVCKVPLDGPEEEYAESDILQAGRELVAGALYGDFADNPSYWSMIGQAVVGFTPLGIAADVRDLVASLKKLLIDGRYSDPLEWLNLGLIVVGFIPGIGDLIKLAGKSTVKWLKESGVVGKLITSGLELIAKAVQSLREHISDVLSRVKSAIVARTTRLKVDFQKQVFDQLKDFRPKFGSRIKTELASDHPMAPYRDLHEPGTRHKLSTSGSGLYDRRHEVPYKEFRDELLSKLDGLTPQQMAEVLVNLGPPGGFPPKSLTPDAIADSAKKYLRWKNDDYNNLRVGPRSENRALGAKIDQDPDKIRNRNSQTQNNWEVLQDEAELPQRRQSDNGFRSQSKRQSDREVVLAEGRVTSAATRNPEATKDLAKKGEDATHAIGVQSGEDIPQAITSAPRDLNRGLLKAYESEVKAVQVRAAELGVEVETHVVLHVKHVMIDGKQVPLLVRIDRTDSLRKVGTDQFIGEINFVADVDSVTREVSVKKNRRRP